MKPFVFPKNQGMPPKRSFTLRNLFNLLFVFSLGFNVYFLFFQNESVKISQLDSPKSTGAVSISQKKGSLKTATTSSEPIPFAFEESIIKNSASD